MEYQNLQNPDETLYEVLNKKEKPEQAKMIPEHLRNKITKEWYVKLLEGEVKMFPEFEKKAADMYALWVIEPPKLGMYFPWPDIKIDQTKQKGVNTGGGVW